MVVTFFVSHFDILGNDCKEEHPLNILDKFVTLVIFKFEILEINHNDKHL